MNYYGSSEEHQPVTWVRGYPLYAAHLIVAVYVASLVVAAVLISVGQGGLLNLLEFWSDEVMQGQVWRVFTYGLVNPPTSLWFAVDMLMIVWFGRELEKFFGRRIFLWFYATQYLLLPLVMLAIGHWLPTGVSGQRGGMTLFLAFATLHPNAVMLFNLLAKWVAIVIVGLQSLIYLSSRNVVGLITLWTTAAYAFAFVRFQQGAFSLPKLSLPRSKPKLRVLPDLPAKKAAARSASDESMAEIDALLDKIATSGMASLTPKERARLDAARNDMLRRTSGR